MMDRCFTYIYTTVTVTNKSTPKFDVMYKARKSEILLLRVVSLALYQKGHHPM